MISSLDRLISTFTASRNPSLALSMSRYMRGHFSFLGIQAPQRKLLQQEFINIKHNTIDWDYVDILYSRDEREFQYVAIDYLKKMFDKITEDDFHRLEQYIISKSWWDTVDTIAPLIGRLTQRYPATEGYIRTYYIPHNNIWIRRVSIIYQLQYKQKTNTDMLEYSIKKNIGSKEFFINKAIGWALREYSKYNAFWVESFLLQYKEYLHSLSIREARKHIKKTHHTTLSQ